MMSSAEAAVNAIRSMDDGATRHIGVGLEKKRDLLAPHIDIDAEAFAFEKIAETMLDIFADSSEAPRIPPIHPAADTFLGQIMIEAVRENAFVSYEELATRVSVLSATAGGGAPPRFATCDGACMS